MSHGHLAAGSTGLSKFTLFPWHCQNSKHTNQILTVFGEQLYNGDFFFSELRLLMSLALALKESKVTGSPWPLGWNGKSLQILFASKEKYQGQCFPLETVDCKGSLLTRSAFSPCIPFRLESRLYYDVKNHTTFLISIEDLDMQIIACPTSVLNPLSIQKKMSPLFLFFPLQSKTLHCLYKISYSLSFTLPSILHMLNIIE